MRAYNNFNGGTDTTTITTGNSGGTSGDAFDAVTTSNSTPAFDASPTKGAMSCRINSAAAANAFVEWQSVTLGTVTTMWGRIYPYFTANPGSTVNLVRLRNGTSLTGSVRLNAAGKILVTDSAGTTQGTMTAAIDLNNFVRVEFKIVNSTTVGVMEAKLWQNANVESTGAADETLTASSINTGTQTDRAAYGATTNVAATYNFDSIEANDTGYPGPDTFAFAGHGRGRGFGTASGAILGVTVTAAGHGRARGFAIASSVVNPVEQATPYRVRVQRAHVIVRAATH